MAVIQGEFPNAPQGGFVNAFLSSALQGFGVDYSPPHEADIGRPVRGDLVTAFPVSALPRQIDGAVLHHYFDDFYNRLHITPRRLVLGNVASTQISDVAVWNAFLVPLTLNSIDGVQEGIELSGPLAFPLTYEALRETTWQVSVSTAGSPSIDVTLIWTFEQASVSLPITGDRITAWPFLVDWSTPVKETLRWRTSVLPSESGVSQRRRTRISPRREFQLQYLLSGRDATLLDLAMHGWGGRVWALPVAPDVQLLADDLPALSSSIPCDTGGREFRVGGLGLLRGDSAFVNEAVEISAVNPDSLELRRPTQFSWPAGARLYPVRAARLLQQPDVTRLTDRDIRAGAEFVIVEANDWPEAVLPQYRGFGVFDERPDEGQDLSRTWLRLLEVQDNVTGVPNVVDTADIGILLQGHQWLLEDIDQRSAWRSLVYTLKGQQVPVWVPSHADDMQLTQIVSGVSTNLLIQEIGYTRFGQGQAGRTDLRIELQDGTVFYRHIVGAAEVDPDMESIQIDAPFGIAVAPQDVLRISFMALMIGEDSVELEHVTDVEGVARSAMTFRAVRDDDV